LLIGYLERRPRRWLDITEAQRRDAYCMLAVSFARRFFHASLRS
jgi:hypothetical protein